MGRGEIADMVDLGAEAKTAKPKGSAVPGMSAFGQGGCGGAKPPTVDSAPDRNLKLTLNQRVVGSSHFAEIGAF